MGLRPLLLQVGVGWACVVWAVAVMGMAGHAVAVWVKPVVAGIVDLGTPCTEDMVGLVEHGCCRCGGPVLAGDGRPISPWIWDTAAVDGCSCGGLVCCCV